MAWVTDELIEVWKSGEFVGENTPMAVVQIQLGHWVRQWNPWPLAEEDRYATHLPKVHAQIWGEGGYGSDSPQDGHWSAVWHASSPWYDLPNLSSIKRTKDIGGQNGVTVLEVVLDAQDFVPKVGALGDSYHALAPGWLAPTRNYVSPSRRDPHWEESDWAPAGAESRVTDSVRIRVWQGYGQPETVAARTPPKDGGTNGTWTFAGMIDDVDVDGEPNVITITARNGKMLTDQRVFRACKSVQLKDPITFYDSLAATEVTRVNDELGDHRIGSFTAHAAYASSHADGHPAANVLDLPDNQWNLASPQYESTWESKDNIDSDHIEWCEVRLPRGRYDEFWLACPAGMLAYVAIYAKPLEQWSSDPDSRGLSRSSDAATMDGHALPEGWVDIGGRAPGPHGGWPYIRTFTTGTTLAHAGIDRPSLGHTFELGEHSILRVGFTHSSPRKAVVSDLHGLRRSVQADIRNRQYILVNDASEVVKVVLRWAGYQNWEVEEAGVRLSDGTNFGPGVVAKSSGRLVFNRSNFLIDIIQEVAKQLGFIFFIADPKHADYPDGIPTFRRDSSLIKDKHYVAAKLTETTMLTGLKVKHSDESRPYIIRVRGKSATGRNGGVPLGGDSVNRIMAVYLPPWAFGSRTGGILRHIVYQDDQLITYAMCLQGCLLIALNAALAMHTAVAEIPAHPLLELDDQVSVLDEPTATNSRLWIVKTTDTMTLGQNASWKATLEGALMDTEDMDRVLAQALGHAPVMIGAHNETVEIPAIDWRHVTDPNSHKESGWRSPVVGTPDARITSRRR